MEIQLKRRNNFIKITLLLAVLIIMAIFAVTQGNVKISVPDVVKITLGLDDSTTIKASHSFIVMQVRIPRILLSLLVGGMLSVIGTIFQALFRNPMADPYVMGVSSGAAFGATIGILFGVGGTFLGMGMVSMLAFIGAMITILCVYQLARVGGKVSTTGILLAGIVINALLSAAISFLMILFHNEIDRIVTWTMGSFGATSWEQLGLIFIPAIVGVGYMMTHARELNAMVMGEDEARALGVSVDRLKKVLLILASLLSAFAVSVSGIIGFVGLIVPHFFRMVFGSDHRVLIPVSFLGGGLFMLVCDTLARSLLNSMEIPVGIITALFGGPFFLMLLQKHKRRSEGI